MKTYIVGGAVRDELLGLPVKDRDYVVVGATPEDMVRQGFKPVGKDFPVFLHQFDGNSNGVARASASVNGPPPNQGVSDGRNDRSQSRHPRSDRQSTSLYAPI